jgi:hypothetical protein
MVDMTDDAARTTGPTPNSSSPQRAEAGRIAEIRQLLTALDSARPEEMDAGFYQHGYWELYLAVRDLLRSLGHEPDA